MNIELNYDLISLSNGLPVALRRLDTPDVSISFSVNAGSIHETEGQYGLTHLVEHLFFRSPDGSNLKENLLQITGRN